MARRGEALVDGRGTARVKAVLAGHAPEVTVRAATMDDAAILHRWRNAEEVRAVSFSSDAISYADHCRWLDNALSNPLQLVLIGTVGDTKVGSIRYALADQGADISIVVAPGMQGRGIGSALIEAGETYLRTVHPDPLMLRALIKPSNRASLKLFEAAGFTRSVEEPDRVLYVKELM